MMAAIHNPSKKKRAAKKRAARRNPPAKKKPAAKRRLHARRATTRNPSYGEKKWIVQVDAEPSHDDEGMWTIFVSGKGARKWAKNKQSVLGERWETDDDDFAYAIVGFYDDQSEVLEALRAEGYQARGRQYPATRSEVFGRRNPARKGTTMAKKKRKSAPRKQRKRKNPSTPRKKRRAHASSSTTKRHVKRRNPSKRKAHHKRRRNPSAVKSGALKKILLGSLAGVGAGAAVIAGSAMAGANAKKAFLILGALGVAGGVMIAAKRPELGAGIAAGSLGAVAVPAVGAWLTGKIAGQMLTRQTVEGYQTLQGFTTLPSSPAARQLGIGEVGYDNMGAVGYDNMGAVGYDNLGDLAIDRVVGAGNPYG